MQPQQQIILLLVVAIVALAALLCEDGLFSIANYLTAETDEHRSLRFSQFLGPNSSQAIANLNTTLNIYLTGDINNPAYSIFETDIIQRYASGRFDYKIHIDAACDRSKTCDNPVIQEGMEPCLAVAKNNGGCWNEHLHCTYPKCRSMVTNDEGCSLPWFDVREYYSASMPNAGYLPLGPRVDSWRSFQKKQTEENFFIKKSSQRRYAFNAVFSKNTNSGRTTLANYIDNNRKKYPDIEIYTKMSRRWAGDVNANWSEQLSTDAWMGIALNSIFTLSPAGHNPECFRLFEAVEAGSIPVITRADLLYAKSMCRDALKHWYDAPILVLTSWWDLFPTIQSLMEDKTKLDEMQVKLRSWYDDYMKTVVGDFEDFMVDSYVKEMEKAKAAEVNLVVANIQV